MSIAFKVKVKHNAGYTYSYFLLGILPNLALFQPGSRHYTGGLHKSQAKLEEKGLKCALPNYHCPLDEVTAAHYDQAGQLHAA